MKHNGHCYFYIIKMICFSLPNPDQITFAVRSTHFQYYPIFVHFQIWCFHVRMASYGRWPSRLLSKCCPPEAPTRILKSLWWSPVFFP